MRGVVQFKFKASNVYDSVSFDGAYITVGELKRSIISKKNLEKSVDFELEVTNSQTGEVYKEDAELVPRNTAVVIKRVPLAQAVTNRAKENGQEFDLPPVTKDDDEAAMIAALVKKESTDWQLNDKNKRDMTGHPPPHYTCKQCGQKGHYIINCPIDKNAIPAAPKKPTGIPRSMLRAVNRTGSLGMKLEDGQSVVLKPNEEVFLLQTGETFVPDSNIKQTPNPVVDKGEGQNKQGSDEPLPPPQQKKSTIVVCALCHRGGHLAPDCPDAVPQMGPPMPFNNPMMNPMFGMMRPGFLPFGMPFPPMMNTNPPPPLNREEFERLKRNSGSENKSESFSGEKKRRRSSSRDRSRSHRHRRSRSRSRDRERSRSSRDRKHSRERSRESRHSSRDKHRDRSRERR